MLEDINISGARGILVNITGGLDMTIGEFEEVGNAIKEFASEDATVVIGTVIEPEMREELRVTVVATGLGQEKQRKQPYKVVKTGTGTTDFEDSAYGASPGHGIRGSHRVLGYPGVFA